MTVTTAIALNRLARYLLPALDEGDRAPTHAEARAALSDLAGQAYKRLAAGVTPERVLRAWPPESAPPRVAFVPGLARARSVLAMQRKPGIPAGEREEGWTAALDALDAELAAEESAAAAYEEGA